MKKLLLLFLLIVSGLTFAQTIITIGTQDLQSGTTGISPYNYYWESRRVQFVYTASEILAAGGFAGNISAIAFDVSQVNGGNLVNYSVRMALTSASDASTHNTATLTEVKSPHLLEPGSTGWRTITFDNNFYWNGTDNILVDVCWGVNSGWSATGQVWMYNNVANQTRGIADEFTNQCNSTTTTTRSGKPRVQLAITATIPLDMAATALVLPSAIGCYGSNETVTVKIQNFGTALIDFSVNPCTVSASVSGPNPATFSPVILNSGTLASTATQDVVISTSYNMTAAGTYTFNASTSVAGDGNTANDAMAPANRTVVAPVSLPQTVDFTGFTGANLTTVFPNWYEAQGTSPLGTTSLWTSQSNLGFAGNITARVNLYTNTRNEWIVGPKFTAAATTVLKFKAAVTKWNSIVNPEPMGSDDKVRVMVSTNCGVSWSPIFQLDASSGLTTSLTEFTVPLGGYAGSDIIIAFYATDGPTDDPEDLDFHLDDIYIGDPPTCPAPTALTATNITTNSADLGWTETGSATTWDIELGPFGFTPTGTPTAAGVTSNPYTYSGLSPATQYSFYVRANCGGGNFSTWVGPMNFTTACSTYSLPFTENFDGPSIPVCWSQTFSGTIPSNRWSLVTTNLAGGTPNEMRAAWVIGTGVSRLISPALNTTGVTSLRITFKHFYDAYGTGINYKVQSSTDGGTWTDEWDNVGGTINDGPRNVTIDITNNLGGTTYIAWVLDGDHYQFDYWYVDNVYILPTPAVDLEFTEFYQSSGLPSPRPSEMFNNYAVSMSNSISKDEGHFLAFSNDVTSVPASDESLTELLKNDFTNNFTESLNSIDVKAKITNTGLNAASYTLNWNVGGAAQSPYSGPVVSAGGNHTATITYNPSAIGTYITSGNISVSGDEVPSNNTANPFRMRVYPNVYSRTIYDRSDNTIDTYIGWGASTPEFIAGVRFTSPSSPIKLAGVDFICRTENIISGAFTVRVRAAGSSPSAPGTVLYTKTYTSADYFASGGDYIFFPFDASAPVIAASTDYWITIEAPLGVLFPGAAHNSAFTPGRSFYCSNPSADTWAALIITYERAWIMRAVHQSPKTLNLTALIEGLYDGINMVSDTVKVELRNASAPYGLVDQSNIILNTLGVGFGTFYSAADATNYYIVVKHRNGLETWSATPQAFSGGTLSYNFTTAATQAYGDNLKLKGTKWCIFSGDIQPQDGLVDLTDVIAIVNDANLFLSGTALPTDLTGDDTVDLTDIIIAVNNSNAFVSVITP